MKKSSKKLLAALGAVLCVVAVVVVILVTVDFEKPSDYYGDGEEKENVSGVVTLEIRCDTVVGKSDNEYVPANGVVLEKTQFEIEDGDTVFDVLIEATKKNKMHIEHSGTTAVSNSKAYVTGLNYIYSGDFGDLSGWLFYVNGKTPSVGCGEFVLKDGDVVEFLYSCDMGSDLGR